MVILLEAVWKAQLATKSEQCLVREIFLGVPKKKIVLRIPHEGFQLGFEQFMIDRAFFGTINIFSWLN